jgi:hypothetical protein
MKRLKLPRKYRWEKVGLLLHGEYRVPLSVIEGMIDGTEQGAG